MNNEKIQLNTDYIGTGSKLFHVSVTGSDWPHPTLWLVAANDLGAAIKTAEQAHLDASDADDLGTVDVDSDGYELGVIL